MEPTSVYLVDETPMQSCLVILATARLKGGRSSLGPRLQFSDSWAPNVPVTLRAWAFGSGAPSSQCAPIH